MNFGTAFAALQSPSYFFFCAAGALVAKGQFISKWPFCCYIFWEICHSGCLDSNRFLSTIDVPPGIPGVPKTNLKNHQNGKKKSLKIHVFLGFFKYYSIQAYWCSKHQNIVKKVLWIFWHPWHLWGCVNSGDISLYDLDDFILTLLHYFFDLNSF